jgi:hypothetical protein
MKKVMDEYRVQGNEHEEEWNQVWEENEKK